MRVRLIVLHADFPPAAPFSACALSAISKDYYAAKTNGSNFLSQLQATRDRLEATLRHRLEPLARSLLHIGLTPNTVSLLGCLLALGAAALIIAGSPATAGLLFLFASSLDMLDGSMARLNGAPSRAGAFLDSALDRIAEGVVFAAIVFYFHRNGEWLGVAAATAALIGAYLTSYSRARGAALGFDFSGGPVKRAERVVLIALGLLWDVLLPMMIVLAVLGILTGLIRLFVTWKKLKDDDDLHRDSPSAETTGSDPDADSGQFAHH